MNFLQLFRIVYTFVFIYVSLLVFLFVLSACIIVLLTAFIWKHRENVKGFKFEHTLGIDEELNIVYDKTLATLDRWGICILDKDRKQGYIRAVKRYPFNSLNWKILLSFAQGDADHGTHTMVAFSIIPEGSLVFLDKMVARNSTKRFSSYYSIFN